MEPHPTPLTHHPPPWEPETGQCFTTDLAQHNPSRLLPVSNRCMILQLRHCGWKNIWEVPVALSFVLFFSILSSSDRLTIRQSVCLSVCLFLLLFVLVVVVVIFHGIPSNRIDRAAVILHSRTFGYFKARWAMSECPDSLMLTGQTWLPFGDAVSPHSLPNFLLRVFLLFNSWWLLAWN